MYLWPEKKADIKQSIAAKANIVPSGYNVAPLAANIPNSATGGPHATIPQR